MFPLQMTGQRDKLVTAQAVVSNVDELDKVILERLGRDHCRLADHGALHCRRGKPARNLTKFPRPVVNSGSG